MRGTRFGQRDGRALRAALVLVALVITTGAMASGCAGQGCGGCAYSCTLPGDQQAAQKQVEQLTAAAERIQQAAETMPINPAPFPSATPQADDISVATSCYDPRTGVMRSRQMDCKATVAPGWVPFATLIHGQPDLNAIEICLPDQDGGPDTDNRIDIEVLRMPGQSGAQLRDSVAEELLMAYTICDVPLTAMPAGQVEGMAQGITEFLKDPKKDVPAAWAGIAGDRLFIIRTACSDDAKAADLALALRRALDSFELLP